MLILRDNISLNNLRDDSSFIIISIFIKFLVVHDFKHFVSSSSAAVQGANGLCNKLNNIFHVFFRFDDQVNIPVANVYRQAFPAEKWCDFNLFFRLRIKMFSEHPESTSTSAKSEALDSLHEHATAARIVAEIGILILLHRWVLMLLEFQFVDFTILLLSLNFKLIFVSL